MLWNKDIAWMSFAAILELHKWTITILNYSILTGSLLADATLSLNAHRWNKTHQASSLAFKSVASPLLSHCKSVSPHAFQMAKCLHLDYEELSFTMGIAHWWQDSIIIIITGGLGPLKQWGWEYVHPSLRAVRNALVFQNNQLWTVKRSLYLEFVMIHHKKFEFHHLHSVLLLHALQNVAKVRIDFKSNKIHNTKAPLSKFLMFMTSLLTVTFFHKFKTNWTFCWCLC